jgi:hypothetical protein
MANMLKHTSYRWLPKEIIFLKQHYRKEGVEYITRKLHRSVRSVKHKLTQLNIYGLNRGPWTSEEDAYIRKCWTKKKPGQIGKRLQRTKQSVFGRAYRLGLREHIIHPWRTSEDKYLIEYYASTGYKEIARTLGRSVVAVTARLRILCKRKKTWVKWDTKKNRTVKKMYQKMRRKELGNLLGHTSASIQAQARKLGVVRTDSKDYTAEELEYIRTNYPTLDVRSIAKKLYRSENAIRSVAVKRGWKGRKRVLNVLTAEQKSIIRKRYATMTKIMLAQSLHIPVHQVIIAGRWMGLQAKKNPFTRSEHRYIASQHGKIPLKDIARHIDRGEYAVRYYGQTQGWDFTVYRRSREKLLKRA